MARTKEKDKKKRKEERRARRVAAGHAELGAEANPAVVSLHVYKQNSLRQISRIKPLMEQFFDWQHVDHTNAVFPPTYTSSEGIFMPGAPALPYEVYRSFIKWAVSGMSGGITEDAGVSTTSALTLLNHLSAYHRYKTGSRIPKPVTRSLTRFIRTELSKDLKLSSVRKKKTFISYVEMKILMLALFSANLVFKLSFSNRLQMACIIVYLFITAIRSGSIMRRTLDLEDARGLKWGDLELCVTKLAHIPDQNHLAIKFETPNAKNKNSQEGEVILAREYDMFIDPVLFWLAHARRTGALPDYSIEQLLDPAFLDDQPGGYRKLKFRNKDDLVFKDLDTGKEFSTKGFASRLRTLSRHIGFYPRLYPRVFRRSGALILKAKGAYPPSTALTHKGRTRKRSLAN